jgi:hypothetical protein
LPPVVRVPPLAGRAVVPLPAKLYQGAQNSACICEPPSGAKWPKPSVGVSLKLQRGWFGLHWTPCGRPNTE